MIEIGQKFKCYQKEHVYNDTHECEPVFAHRSVIGNLDYTGRMAFNGRVFTCEKIYHSRRRGTIIVSGDYRLRQDSFEFEIVKE